MIKKITSLTLYFLTSLCIALPAQDIFKGKVIDKESGKALSGASLFIKETSQSTIAETNGSFEFKINHPAPLTLVVSMLGYKRVELVVNSFNTLLVISLESEAIIGDEIVISASRVEEHVMQSPVTIERLGALELKQSTSPSYYTEITKMKGMSYTQHSLGWISLQPRFLGSHGSEGMLQLIDGVDMTVATLGFPVGNLGGISDLDIRSIEMIPGAASALYGPNAFEGALLIYSKNPFTSKGLSAQVKSGFTNSDAGGINPYNSASIRWAQSISNKLAFKINLNGLWGSEWKYNDYITDRNTKTKDRTNAPDFNGLNTYGDDFSIFLPFNAPQLQNPLLDALTPQFAAATGKGTTEIRPILEANLNKFAPIQIARTGYKDEDLLDNNRVKNISAAAGLFYRLNPDLELSYNYHIGSGSGAYVGANKYSMRNFILNTHKLELKGNNFFIRGYLFQGDAGDSYNLTALGSYVNEKWSPTGTQWIPTYAGTYAATLLNIILTQNITPEQLTPDMIAAAHNAARQAADANRFLPGTPEFKNAVDSVRRTFFKDGGATFFDNSRHYHAEAMYDFTSMLNNQLGLQIGGNYRKYSLFTNNTIFNDDPDGDGKSDRIRFAEYGAYLQASKALLKDRIKLLGSVRYDKNDNFEGQFSPRLSLTINTGADHQYSFRASYQTGFQNPTAQQMYIYLPVGPIIIGNVASNIDRYGLHNGGSWTQASYNQYIGALIGGASPDEASKLLVVAKFDYVKPQQVTVWEAGFRTLFGGKLYCDLNVFYNKYKNLFNTTDVVNINPTSQGGKSIPSGTSWSIHTNATEELSAAGSGISLDYRINSKLELFGNYSYASATGDDWKVNIPEHRTNLGVSGTNLYKSFGYSLSYRWQSAFDFYTSNAFGNGKVPAYGTFDAQINYSLPAWKAQIKLGGTNILGKDFQTFPGGAQIGSIYYIAVTFDELWGNKE